MKTVRDEIEQKLANVSPGHASPLMLLPESAPAWVLRQSNGRFGVGVPYDGEIVAEEFAGARLHSVQPGALRPDFPGLLMLSSTDEQRRNEFSLLCSDFVDPGAEGWRRQSLVQRPLAWWEGWRELLGNAVREMKPHAVLGELLIYEYLLNESPDSRVAWNGPGGASHDLQCRNRDVEVKSTLQKYESVVEVTGQFQLQEGAALELYLCRLEPSKHGTNINDMVARLSKHPGIAKGELNARLASLGYEEGNSARRTRYVVLEVRKYQVDDSFPRISAGSFADGMIPPGILRISYAVDLGMVPGETVQLDKAHYGDMTDDGPT